MKHETNLPYAQDDIDYFDRFVEGYTPYTEDDIALMVRPLSSALTDQSLSVCEIGCASGQFSRELAKRVVNTEVTYYGLDIALNVLRTFPFQKICGSAFQVPLATGAVDVVCLPAALHHLFPLDRSVQELTRILKCGGLFYCIEPNYYHPQRRYFMRFSKMYRWYRRANDVPINPDELRTLLSDYGYQILHFDYFTISFKQPSILQRVQNAVSRRNLPGRMQKYINPCFLLLAQKMS